jgi:hypothetical protein
MFYYTNWSSGTHITLHQHNSPYLQKHMLYHNNQPQPLTINTKTNLQHEIIHQLRLTRRDCTQRWTYNSNVILTMPSFLLFLPLFLPYHPLLLPSSFTWLSFTAVIQGTYIPAAARHISSLASKFYYTVWLQIVFRWVSRHSYPLLLGKVPDLCSRSPYLIHSHCRHHYHHFYSHYFFIL